VAQTRALMYNAQNSAKFCPTIALNNKGKTTNGFLVFSI
jgi:hypothetical protein